ncbi:MAG: hypothetical protein K0Q73_3305, partial [Paenibacillus sp.]|nr:hypothetical protein [Paenibacillus sp.]
MKRYIGSVLFAVFLCLFMFAVTSESPSIEAAQVNSGGEAVSNNEAPPSVEYIISFELPADDRVIRLSAVQESIIIMLRILKVLVTAVVVGFLFFRYVIWGAGRKELSALFELQSERRLYWTAVILLGGAGAAEIGMLSHLFSGTEANSWITEVRIMTTTTIRGTTAYITPFLACILLLSAYFGYTEGRWTKMFKLVLAVAIVCTFPLSGHAYGSFLNVVFHALHMLAA